MRFRELYKLVKSLIEEHYCVLLYWENGKDLCLLYKHWKYLNPINDAPRVYLGRYDKPNRFVFQWDNVLYLYSVDHFKEHLRKGYRRKIKR